MGGGWAVHRGTFGVRRRWHAHGTGGDEGVGAGFDGGAGQDVDEMYDDVGAVESKASTAAVDAIAPGKGLCAHELEDMVHRLRVLGVVPAGGVFRWANEEAAIVGDDLEALEWLGDVGGELGRGKVVGQDVEEVARADAAAELKVEHRFHLCAKGRVVAESEVGGGGARVAGGAGDGQAELSGIVLDRDLLSLSEIASGESEKESVVHAVGGRSAAAVPVGDLEHLQTEGVADEVGAGAELDASGMEGATGIESILGHGHLKTAGGKGAGGRRRSVVTVPLLSQGEELSELLHVLGAVG